MKLGTRSLLFGVHHFLLHPLLVGYAWRRVYGRWPTCRQAFCILVHDIGYFGCEEMDGPEGSQHPEFGARVAGHFLGDAGRHMVLFHSRVMAKQYGQEISALCLPDKLTLFLYPAWLYTSLGRLSGELREYQQACGLQNEIPAAVIYHLRFRAFRWAVETTVDLEVRARIEAVFAASYTRSQLCVEETSPQLGQRLRYELLPSAAPRKT